MIHIFSRALDVCQQAEIILYLKKEFKLDVANIKILSQYNAQRNLIEQKLIQLSKDHEVLDRYDKNKVNVSTVVSSQGDLIFFHSFCLNKRLSL